MIKFSERQLSRFLVIMHTYLWITISVLAACPGPSLPAKILAVVPMPWKSHHFVFHAIINELAKRGHKVDYLTPFRINDPHPNINHLMVKDTFNDMIGTFKVEDLDPMWGPSDHLGFRRLITENMRYLFTEDPQIKKLMMSNDTYDIVLSECQLFQELNAVWIHKFNATGITLYALGDFYYGNEFNGLPNNPAYMVDYSTHYTDRMNFVERLVNTVEYIGMLVVDCYYLHVHQQMADSLARYPGWESRPPLSQLVSDMALVLVNSHHAVGYSYPKAPHVKEIGGMTLGGSTDLPHELKSFMDEAKHGVVYISLGSNVDMNVMTKGNTEQFLDGFRSLKQKVILKWRGDHMPVINDSHIMIQTWFPQLGILAHPNIKVFVMHGGLQSLFESVNFGVPMVGVPIFGDQNKDVSFLVSKGMGIKINKRNFTKESLIWAINEVVSNPRYTEAVERNSDILKDVPMNHLQEAMYWIEYVIKHGKVLQPASVHMPFYQIFLLDVLLFISVSIIILYYALLHAFRILRKLVKNMLKTKKKVE